MFTCSPRNLAYIVFLLFTLSAYAEEDEFPGRRQYPAVDFIELQEFYQQLAAGEIVAVDVRTDYEYNTLHIKGAFNVSYTSHNFAEEMQALQKQHPGKKLALYCNGKTCLKSYKAASKCRKYGIENVIVYDAGVFDYAKAYPQDTNLFGEVLGDPGRLIGKDKLKAHTITVAEFEDKIIKTDGIVLDVRDKQQREGIAIFFMREKRAPLDRPDLIDRYINQAKKRNVPLLIYDQAGKQIRWLQYYLEKQNVSSYYFMAGGIDEYYKTL
ncbi:predicted sulfurtransferase [Hahella chejuensis KCTC 2396]|uniref:Predicted sulfurtransferase n=1 Tax=Hahella chejuensis (strain KCTC 2396) TaxID=349521 RepID=Q2SQQ3_HAHCH|nr:rhodanese-like domain-containing protein [Hahella chejuensis]ABC27021.1 predicted sulfurtransferase [Hahella chejuensis KCTC 2396]